MKTLLVDLDDTLLDYSGGVDDCWKAACRTIAPAGMDVASLVESVRTARRWFWDDPERHRRERVNMLGAWTKIVAHGFERLGTPNDTLAAAIAEDFAARRWEVMCLFHGTVETLGGLRGIWIDRERTGLAAAAAVRPHRIIKEFPEILES